MTLTYEQIKSVWTLNNKIDNLLENCRIANKNIQSTLYEVYKYIENEIKVSSFFVETQNEKLIMTDFCFGNYTEEIKNETIKLKFENEINCFSIGDHTYYITPLDVSGKIIGKISIGIKKSNAVNNDEYFFEVVSLISELLDTYLFAIQSECLKQSLIMGLQNSLAEADINESLKKAANVLYEGVNFKHLLIVYDDFDILNETNNIKYVYFDKNKLINDDVEKPFALLENIIKTEKNFFNIESEKLQSLLGKQNTYISYLRNEIYNERSLGFIFIETENNKPLTIMGKELILIFKEELRQRVIDLNREKSSLRHYFSNQIISKLIKIKNYEKLLLPKEAEVGVLFADLSGFTKISEQILVTPNKISNFINEWSKGVVKRLFPFGVVLDKIIGDCVMLLFGPPFYEDSKEETINKMLMGAKIIVDFTREYLEMPQNKLIQKHPDFHSFGVSIGINYCHSIVGIIGPNKNLTAFSSGVNITSRLQHLAKNNEILITERVKNIASNTSNDWHFSEKKYTLVKNIEDPLLYYSLVENK